MEGALTVVSYPDFPSHDHNWIESFREAHDAYFTLIPAHLTLVFPVFNWERKEFIRDINRQVRGSGPYQLKIKCAIRNNDLTSDLWHVLLVPDEGFSETVKLHDRLYGKKFTQKKKLNLDFIPHIAIGNSKDPLICKQLINKVNSMNININTNIKKLNIIKIKNNFFPQ